MNFVKSFLMFAVVGMVSSAPASAVSFQTIQLPTDLFFGTNKIRASEVVRGLNDVGNHVGSFGERNGTTLGVPHGYIFGYENQDQLNLLGTGSFARSPEGFRIGRLEGSVNPSTGFRYLDFFPENAPREGNTRYAQLNAISNSGIVVGKIAADFLGRNPSEGFIFNSNTRELSILNVPGSDSTWISDIDRNGNVVGGYSSNRRERGFLYRNGQFTYIDAPWTSGSTFIGGMNDLGDVVGSTAFGGSFVWRNGEFKRFTVNGSGNTAANDINNRMQIVGTLEPSGKRTSFVYHNGDFISLDFGTASTWAYTINNKGQVGGSFGSTGFITEAISVGGAIPEPSSWAMLIAGFGLVGGTMRRLRHALT